MNILASLYGFQPTDVFLGCRYSGDEAAGRARMGLVCNALQTLHDVNVWGLQIYDHTVQFDDGTVVTAHRRGDQYWADVEVPNRIPKLNEGEFYWIPGCKARYGFAEGKELYNEIPLKAGSVSGDTSNSGAGIAFLTIKEAGLPSPGVSPGGLIARLYRVCRLTGVDPDSGDSGSRLSLASSHIPTTGAFSISCVVRLREPIEMDYSFQYQTEKLNNGYTVWNPIKARVLTSADGEKWSATCPGSIAPLVGYQIPSKFSNHWVKFSYPWPDYNNDFPSNAINQIGYREIYKTCENEPLMQSDYDPSSPYWDKVETSDLETLGGEFTDNWEENTEIENAAPYASFCKFKVSGNHGKSIGTRVIGSLQDGNKRYATVYCVDYEYNDGGSVKNTIFTLKDYQYKLYMTNAETSLTFGNQPFPVCHPKGFMIGMNIMGMSWFNGDKILAGKICDFENEYKYTPIVSESLDIGSWYYVCATYDDEGKTCLYTTKIEDSTINSIESSQSTGVFVNSDELGNFVKIMIGAENWAMGPSSDSPESAYISQWEYSSSMDIGMLRFYHRELSKTEVKLLANEVFRGIFVADDFEAGTLVGLGYKPIEV